jgi:hypothetical protein
MAGPDPVVCPPARQDHYDDLDDELLTMDEYERLDFADQESLPSPTPAYSERQAYSERHSLTATAINYLITVIPDLLPCSRSFITGESIFTRLTQLAALGTRERARLG